MKEAIRAINKYDRFLITAHVNLEGDSIGSQLATKELLDAIGKKSFIVDDDRIPEHYKFLPGADKVSNNTAKAWDFDAVIVVDCPNLKRTGKVADIISKKKVPIINIDHHISNERFGTVNWVDPAASSAGEMIFRLFKAMNIPISKGTALSLYITILTDTGSFNYDNTSRATHEIAGELLGYGLDPAIVSEKVYEQRSVDDIKLLGLVLSTLKLNKRGDVAYLEVTRKMLKSTGLDASRSEGFINYARSIENVKIAIFFKEDTKKAGRISVSFRAKSGVDVNGIAAYFGGGGHVKAAGCMVKGNLAQVEKKVLARVEEELKIHGRNTDNR